MFINNGAPEMVLSRGAIIRSPRGLQSLGIPNIIELQNDALDAVSFAARKYLNRVDYQEGNILFYIIVRCCMAVILSSMDRTRRGIYKDCGWKTRNLLERYCI